jgi:hypothetical protein
MVQAQTFTAFSYSGENLFYLNEAADIGELSCPVSATTCVPVDLTLLANLPHTGTFSHFTTFVDAAGPHMFFIDGSNFINYVHFGSNGTINTPLGVQSYDRGPTGYRGYGAEWLFYEAANQHIHLIQFSADGNSKNDADLTKEAGGSAAAWTPLSSFNDSSGDHLFYVGTDQHLYQLYGQLNLVYTCSAGFPPHCSLGYQEVWSNQDITKAAELAGAAPEPVSLAGLAGFSAFDGEHVGYIGVNQHVCQFHWNGTNWIFQDLNLNGATEAVWLTGSGISTAYLLPYIGTDGRVHSLNYTSAGWSPQDVTTLADGPAVLYPCGGPQLASLGNSQSGSIFYVAADGNLHRLIATLGLWRDQKLTGLTGQVPAAKPYDFCAQ